MENRKHFPGFKELPWFEITEAPHYREDVASGINLPAYHWCLLGEIINAHFLGRYHVKVRDRDGVTFLVSFYHDTDEKPVTFSWTDLKPGATLAVMYAHKKQMLDGSVGIRQEELFTVYVFNARIEVLMEESSKVLIRRCYECSAEENLLQCGGCKIALYCSKDHQALSWKNSHKNLCKQFKVLKQLMNRITTPFEERFLTFHVLAE